MSTTTNSLIPPHYLSNTAAVLGTFILANNTYGALNPRTTLSMLGFPSTTMSPTDQTLIEGMTTMFCTTRMALGLTTLAMWWHKDYKALGWSMLAGSVMAIGDGIVSRRVSGKGEWGHWGAIPISLGVGMGLIGIY